MVDKRLQDLRQAILKVLADAAGSLTIPQLEEKLRQQNIPFWPGEVQEVAWRLTAARNLHIAASGAISKPELVKKGER